MMTDDELAEFLGIAKAKRRAEIMALITPAERAEHEETARLVMEVKLWEAGVGPRPAGVIMCHRRKRPPWARRRSCD